MRALSMVLLVGMTVSSCRRRAAPEQVGEPVAHPDPSASALAPPPPLGDVVQLVGTWWGACARTSTGRVWCFSSSTLRGRVVDALRDAAEVVALGGSIGPDENTRCAYCAVCARMAKGSVACASNVRSTDLLAICGQPTAVNGPADPRACAAPFDDLRVDGVRAIGVGHTATYRTRFCDGDFPPFRAYDVGVLLARDKDALVIPFVRGYSSTCCSSLEPLLGHECAPNGPLSGCGTTYGDAPASWIDGLARMADGSVRRLPARSADEIPALRDAVRIEHAMALACMIDSSGTVRCMNEPFDGICPYGPRPSYRDWHVVKGLEGATDLAILDVAETAVCVLRGGSPWCWGLDGLATTGATPAPPQHVLGRQSNERCDVAYGEGPMPHHCARTPKRVHDIGDATQIVATGGPEGFCVLRAGGKISCWGGKTDGVLQEVTPPPQQ